MLFRTMCFVYLENYLFLIKNEKKIIKSSQWGGQIGGSDYRLIYLVSRCMGELGGAFREFSTLLVLITY